MKFTDFLSRNSVEGVATENIYDEQYVIIILTEQAELNLKYGRIFTNQSQRTPNNKITRERKLNNQSETNRTFETKRRVNKINEQAETSPNKTAIKFKRHTKLPVQKYQELPLPTSEEMDRECFHWGATTEIMKIIQRLKLHTDGEMPTGEKENKYLETENIAVRKSNRNCM